MERIPTNLIVENGQVFTTDKPMPEKPEHINLFLKSGMEKFNAYQAAIESRKKEAYTVVNTMFLYNQLLILHDAGVFIEDGLCAKQDGIYNAPDGLVFEVKEYCGCHLLTGPSDECIAAGGTNPYKCVKERNKVAILSFKEPSKENIWKGIYIGKEFPDYYGKEIDITDDNSDPNFPCYQIRFAGEDYWHDNMDDNDFKAIEEPTKEPSSERPDFEKMAEEVLPYRWSGEDDPHGIKGRWFVEDYSEGAERIWNDHVIPLQQEIERLREELKSKQ